MGEALSVAYRSLSPPSFLEKLYEKLLNDVLTAVFAESRNARIFKKRRFVDLGYGALPTKIWPRYMLPSPGSVCCNMRLIHKTTANMSAAAVSIPSPLAAYH
jgi:hypothetical protein